MATTVDLTEIGYRVLNVTGVKGFQLKPVSGEEFAYHLIVFTPSIEWVIGVQKVWAQSRNLAEDKVKADHPGAVIGRVEVTNSITAVIE